MSRSLPKVFRRPLAWAAVIVVIGLLAIGTVLAQSTSDLIPSGVTLDGHALAGMTWDQALEFGSSLPYKDSSIELTDGDKSIRVQLALAPDAAWLKKTLADVRSSIGLRERILGARVNLQMRYELTPSSEQVLIRQARSSFERPPQDAALMVRGDQVLIADDRPGSRVLPMRLASLVEAQRGQGRVTVPTRPIPADINRRDLAALKIDTLMSKFTTSYDVAKVNRTWNILLASRSIDMLILPPGGIFSYNEVVGPRTAERGFKEAQVIGADGFVPGLGGGICQVSSTVYAAALYADLEILERINHSLPVAYVPMGLDATVVYDTQDLKIRNDTPGYVLLSVRNDTPGELTVRIFGSQKPPALAFETEIIGTHRPPVRKVADPSLPPGGRRTISPGQPGYMVLTYRVEPGGKRRQISTSHYRPLPAIVAEGPTAPAPAGGE